MTKDDIQKKAINLVLEQKTQWEDATASVTEKVAFNMRNLIRQCRKNYWGVFDSPSDEETGKAKIWFPLTMETCEASGKNHQTDAKDINFKAKKEVRRMMNKVIKAYTLNSLKDNNFADLEDQANRQLDIDGTVVWKVQEGENGKPKITNVDLLNFYIDPTADSIQSTSAVIERVVMTPSEVKGMKDWINTDVSGQEGVERTGDDISTQTSKQKMVEVFIYEGLAPKYLMTGKDIDDEMVNLRIIISEKGGQKEKGEGLKGNVHLIEDLDKFKGKPIKSYEECWLTRVNGRWYGIGTAEKLLMIQLYMNIIGNTRKTKQEVASLGLFKIRDGSGITPQMLKRLPVNGAIKVAQMDDIENFVVNGATQQDYQDEEVAKSWAQRVTQTFEAVTGETMAATTTATVGAIQSRSGSSSFVGIKKAKGIWLERVLNNHYIPMLKKKITKGDIVKICLDSEELREYDDEYADIVANEFLLKKGEQGFAYVDIQEVEQVKNKVKEDLAKGNGVRYHNVVDDIDLSEYDCEVYVDNERIDKNVLVTDLLNSLKVAPEYKESILKKVFDLVGIDVRLTPQQPQLGGGQELKQPQSANQQMTSALTGSAMGLNG